MNNTVMHSNTSAKSIWRHADCSRTLVDKRATKTTSHYNCPPGTSWRCLGTERVLWPADFIILTAERIPGARRTLFLYRPATCLSTCVATNYSTGFGSSWAAISRSRRSTKIMLRLSARASTRQSARQVRPSLSLCFCSRYEYKRWVMR